MLTRADNIKSCYVGPAISPEQFIPEHFFLYLLKGKIAGFDGHKKYSMKAGEWGFKKIFNDTPNHWLIQKRLDEAYFLIERKGKNHRISIWIWGLRICHIFPLVLRKSTVSIRGNCRVPQLRIWQLRVD
ncbi:hypothetical protein SAMN05421740_103264 [Parapedobacter koreensis]|uniref:Uncharacterized protein n=1 Tax=Parapedobacter koreensis TaxID=332977 RepID=A0A1H7LTK4_9SPHI|nr:hypothetical protein SAMN05421740_103264 [Parapedobacter koreensis]